MNSIRYNLALDNGQFVGSMRAARAEVDQLAKSTRSANLGSIAGEMQLASGSASEFSSRLKASSGSLQSWISDLKSGTGSMAGYSAALSGAAIVIGTFTAAVMASKAVLADYAPYDSTVRSLAAIEGGSALTTARLEKMRDVAKMPGLGFQEAVKGDVRLRSVGLSADLSERSLRAVGNALAGVGAGKSELDGVLLAFTQIAAKGVVSAEEIGQIAERMPQVRQAMKDAFGTADTEGIQKMGLSATQFIEGLVGQLEKLPKVTGGAQNAIENFDDSWSQLKNTTNEFFVGTASGFLDYVSGSIQGATRDLKKLQDAFGLIPANLEGPVRNSHLEERKRKREEEAEAARKAAEEFRAVEEANLRFWQALDEQRREHEAKQREKKVQEEQRNAERVKEAQQRVFAASLTERENLERQIRNLERSGAGDANAINNAKSSAVAADLAEKTALLLELKKRLADLNERDAKATDDARKAGAAKAEQAAKEEAARSQAAESFRAEQAILEAKVSGNKQLADELEKQKRIHDLKLQIMRDQNVEERAALAMATRRVQMEDSVNQPNRGSIAERNAARRAERAEARDARRNNKASFSNAEESLRGRYDQMSEADKKRAGSFEDWKAGQGIEGQNRARAVREATEGAADAANPQKIGPNMDETNRKLDKLASIDRRLENIGIAA